MQPQASYAALDIESFNTTDKDLLLQQIPWQGLQCPLLPPTGWGGSRLAKTSSSVFTSSATIIRGNSTKGHRATKES
jgi:hypothetical protein